MNIAVCACLLGEPCRYDGASCPVAAVQALAANHTLVPVCPEQMGGLPTPRIPCEIVCQDPLCIQNHEGEDRTSAFELGARVALRVAQEAGCHVAVLKSRSPSCGSGTVYDGTFSGSMTEGWGVAARLFAGAGITVVDELNMPMELTDTDCMTKLVELAAEAPAEHAAVGDEEA